jgi:hypothetical protein
MKVIEGKKFWEKLDVLEEYPISERTFFTRVKKYKTIFPNHMNNKMGFWVIDESVIPKVFEIKRRPSLKEFDRFKKWVLLKKWNLIGNIRTPKSTSEDNHELMNFLFDLISKEFPHNEFELLYVIEKNPLKDNNTNENYYHSHFLINTDIVDWREIQRILYNHFPNFDLEKYNEKKFGDYGKKYTLKNYMTELNNIGYSKKY